MEKFIRLEARYFAMRINSQIFFLKTLPPSFWPHTNTIAYQALVIWNEPSQKEELQKLFGESLLESTNEEFPYYLVRSFQNGVANPVAQSLSMLLNITEENICVDQLLLLPDNRMDDLLYEKMQKLWREPAIENLRIRSVKQWWGDRATKPSMPERRDPSMDPMLPGEGDLEWTADEEKVLLDKAKSMGRAWTRTELELIAQTWSEHCKHKIFSAKISSQDTLEPFTESLFKTHLRAPALEKAQRELLTFLEGISSNRGLILKMLLILVIFIIIFFVFFDNCNKCSIVSSIL
jgi:hypothetical protein